MDPEKTTTINIVSGLSKPTYGQVIVLGHDIMKNTRSVHAALGAVPQETALYEELSAWTNMSVHADLYRVGRSLLELMKSIHTFKTQVIFSI